MAYKSECEGTGLNVPLQIQIEKIILLFSSSDLLAVLNGEGVSGRVLESLSEGFMFEKECLSWKRCVV